MIGVDVVFLLAAAAGGLLLGRALGLPSIVGYLLVGVVAGPNVLGLVEHSSAIEQLAELGVALLLFGVGIEFSLDRMRRTFGVMLASGGGQIAATIAFVAAAFRAVGSPWPVAVFFGFLVALSSTAIVFKLYDESGEIDAPQGRAAAGILLFQDLALVPMSLLVPVLARPGEDLFAAASFALGKAALALVVLLALARAVLPRALERVARARIPELFPLAALVAAFGTALCATLLGLSLPIGAFLAGLALSGSRYAHQVFAELLPLRDAFVALFFTSIGMLFRPGAVVAEPLIPLLLLGAVFAKAVIAGGIVHAIGGSREIAILTGLALAQIGEFSFVLARQGVAAGLLSAEQEQGFLGAAILTMAATPFLIDAGRRLASVGAARRSAAQPPEDREHVLVLGYGQTGQAVARVLRETGIPFRAVDLVAQNVEIGRRDGIPVHFGDASRRVVLDRMGAGAARAAVVTVGDPGATRRIVAQLRQASDRIRILVRARRVTEIDELERIGADEVIASEFEVSIELFVRLLTRLGVPRHVVRIEESLIRTQHYRALRGLGTSAELLAETKRLVAGGVLETAQVMARSEAAGRTLAELDLQRRTGIVVLSVVRDDAPLPAPGGSTRLLAGDLVVIFGPHEAIDQTLSLLEPRDAVSERPDGESE